MLVRVWFGLQSIRPITINIQFCISSLPILWAIKFKIKETGRAKWQKRVKLKSCLPPLTQADSDTILISIYHKQRGQKRGPLLAVFISHSSTNDRWYFIDPCTVSQEWKGIKLKLRLPPSRYLSWVKLKSKI